MPCLSSLQVGDCSLLGFAVILRFLLSKGIDWPPMAWKATGIMLVLASRNVAQNQLQWPV